MDAQGNIVTGARLSVRRAFALLSAVALTVAPLIASNSALAADQALNLAKPEIINAIEKAKILAPGISVNADVYRDQVSVSTYRNTRANDDDCKIEAAMIAKTVLDLAPKEISRVMIYFFSMANPTQYREVAVTTGDIKAFSAGQTDEKQLISSLKLVEPPMSSIDRQLLEQYVKSSLAREPEFIKTQTDDLIEVQSELPGNLPAIDYQMEALRIAHRAILQSDISAVKRIKLYLKDPTRDGEIKTMAFQTDAVEQVTGDITRLFEGLAIVPPTKPAPSIVQSFPADKIELDKLETVPGDLEQERKDILERIRALDKLGVGVIPFARLYIKIESEVGNTPLEQLQEDVQRLSDALDQQDKNYATAKDFHAVKKGQKVAVQSSSSTEASLPASLGDIGDPKQLEQKILKDPNGLIVYYEQRLTRKNHPGETHPNFPTILDFFAATLKRNNRGPEAAKFEQRAAALRAKRAQPTTTAVGGDTETPGGLKSGTPVTPPAETTSTKPVEKPPESE
jgi:hypothetical protein